MRTHINGEKVDVTHEILGWVLYRFEDGKCVKHYSIKEVPTSPAFDRYFAEKSEKYRNMEAREEW